MSHGKKTVLILLGAYWPGHESTGPNISIRAMCEMLSDEFSFLIVARDRGYGAKTPLVDNLQWHDFGYAKVRYLTVGSVSARNLRSLLRETPHHLLMINSFFDREFTFPALLFRRLGLVLDVPVLLSPRGELSRGALSIHNVRKRIYYRFAKFTNLLKNARFHATSPAEAIDCKANFANIPVAMVENFRSLQPLPDHKRNLESPALRVVFLGRISPVKGLDFALRVLAKTARPVVFHIYGPVSDPAYWRSCAQYIQELPNIVQVRYCGEIGNSETVAMLAMHDVMLLPSLSENFGHAIFESLVAGTPVIIGNQTPWVSLSARKAGWDTPVGDGASFARALQFHADMDEETRNDWRAGARAVALSYAEKNTGPAKMRLLFREMALPEFAHA